MSFSEFFQGFSGLGGALGGLFQQGQDADAIRAGLSLASQPSQGLASLGSQYGVPPAQSAPLLLSPLGRSSDASTPQAGNGSISPFANAISSIESGGRYDAVGPTTGSGDRAYGKYQVMGANIPSWTQEALGKSLTPEQFKADPAAQDAVFANKFGAYVEKYGPSGAAQAWFGGPGSVGSGGGARDVLGTSGSDYVSRFNKALAANGGVAPPAQVQAPAPATPVLGQPAMQVAAGPGAPSAPDLSGDFPVMIKGKLWTQKEAANTEAADSPFDTEVVALQDQVRRNAALTGRTAGPDAAVPAAPQASAGAAQAVPASPSMRAPAGGDPETTGAVQPAAESPFIPGTTASPAVQQRGALAQPFVPPQAAQTPFTPDQIGVVTRLAQSRNPTAQALAQNIIGTRLGKGAGWDLKELKNGQNVLFNAATGATLPVPGSQAPTTLTTQKGSDGNDYTFNPSTGQWTRAIEGKANVTTLITPEQRARYGVDPSYKGVVQVDSDGTLAFPGKPSTEVNVNQTAEKAQDSKIGGAYGDTFNDLQKGGRDAAGQLNTYRLMEKLIDHPEFTSGTGSATMLAFKRAATGLGIKDADTAAPNELFAKLANQSVIDKLGGNLGAGVSNSDVAFMSNTTANLQNTPEGNRQIVQFGKALAQRQIDVAKLARQYAGAHGGRLDAGFDDTLAEYADKNPLFPEQTKLQQQRAQPKPQSTAKPLSDDIKAQARDAIQKGAPAAGVIQRLKDQGFDPSGL